jgi:hypothetical protein
MSYIVNWQFHNSSNIEFLRVSATPEINRSLTKWPLILCTYLSFSQFIVLPSSSCGFPLHPSPFILRELNVDQQLTSAQLFLMDRSSSQWPLTLLAQPRALRKFLALCRGHAIPAEDTV